MAICSYNNGINGAFLMGESSKSGCPLTLAPGKRPWLGENDSSSSLFGRVYLLIYWVPLTLQVGGFFGASPFGRFVWLDAPGIFWFADLADGRSLAKRVDQTRNEEWRAWRDTKFTGIIIIPWRSNMSIEHPITMSSIKDWFSIAMFISGRYDF